jgi:ADP-heptose:LPS heptosyltransferase
MRILLIRFSSIGDIILTTPVIRCLKKQLPEVEIHYLTKAQYLPLLERNPYIDRLITIDSSVREVISELRSLQYDHIIDLHKNLRTKHLLFLLHRRAHTFNKLNKKKFLLVWFKINLLPKIHIVDRYMKAVAFLGVVNDKKGLDYFIANRDEAVIAKQPVGFQQDYIALVIGAKQFTKQIPATVIVSLCSKLSSNVVLIGGPEDRDKGERVVNESGTGSIFNTCGMYDLNQSAALLANARVVITADTGMMHIAAALRKEIVSIWGNTVPDFGMYPYLPAGSEHLSHIVEVKGLTCRPCTKLGYKQCPRGHFLCMLGNDQEDILKWTTDRPAEVSGQSGRGPDQY